MRCKAISSFVFNSQPSNLKGYIMDVQTTEQYEKMDLLRFTTAGSVDDGKSTLIGRLLYDSKSIFEDQYEAIRSASERRGETDVNLSLLTDGLRAEREQGLRLTWLIATSPPLNVSSSLPIPRSYSVHPQYGNGR